MGHPESTPSSMVHVKGSPQAGSQELHVSLRDRLHSNAFEGGRNDGWLTHEESMNQEAHQLLMGSDGYVFKQGDLRVSPPKLYILYIYIDPNHPKPIGWGSSI